MNLLLLESSSLADLLQQFHKAPPSFSPVSILFSAWNHLLSHDDATHQYVLVPYPPITFVFRFPPTSPPSFSVLLVPSHPFSLLLLAWHRLLRRLLDSPSPPDVCTTGCPLIVFGQLLHFLNMNIEQKLFSRVFGSKRQPHLSYQGARQKHNHSQRSFLKTPSVQ